jgi:TolB-like protein
MTEPSRAVFLSYASQDAEAAAALCQALRDAGVEVWFDQTELRGGDAWDQSIRRQIKACRLFIPVISAHTHDRREGYFRLEWKLAVDRCHQMDPGLPFLLPVAIDATRGDDRVPERFREVQWARLPAGASPTEFVERVRHLVSDEATEEPTRTGESVATAPPRGAHRLRRAAGLLASVAALIGLWYVIRERYAPPEQTAAGSAVTAARSTPPAAATFSPLPHSIAVLPFINLSGEKDQEYFADGLTEELLNALAEVDQLQVAARTSAFSFKGKDNDVAAIGHKLNVATVLEGSVRRSARTVRITAELVSTVTGFHVWSKSYDRNLGDVLKLQTEIATAVASALKITLLADIGARVELGGTHNPAAFDA